MSGIFGIWNLDGQPVDGRLLRRLTELMGHRGPDREGSMTDGTVGLGHRLLCATPESLTEKQPLWDGTGRLCLAFDGRLDNREELRVALEGHGRMLQSHTDPDLVLRAYEQWDEGCPRYLLGDFAFAIWDARNRRLFCARDHLGMKPLYYYHTPVLFLCSSELRPLLEHPAVPREPNDEMIGEYLANAITSQQDTLYRGIVRLPPAHSLTISSGRFRLERYWDIDAMAAVRYCTDQDYAAHFLALLKEAVRCRLRGGPTGAYLSGGLDSSSVVATACALSREAATSHRFETFSLVFPGLPCDERQQIEAVARRWNLASHEVAAGKPDRAAFEDSARLDLDFPGYPNGIMGNPLRALAQQRGIRVLLTGLGGDEWLTGSEYHLADLLRRLQLVAAIRRAGAFGEGAWSESLFSLARYGLWPQLPWTARRIFRRTLAWRAIPSWINPRFARRIHLAERITTEVVGQGFASLSQADLHSGLTSGWWPHNLEIEERAASRFGLEERHPFTDRRLVQFALTIPEEQRHRGGSHKFVLRQAMTGILPELIRQRRTKAEFSVVFVQALKAAADHGLFDSLAAASVGWVDQPRVQEAYRKMITGYACGGTDYIPLLWPLWMIVGIELWLRAVMSHSVVPQSRSRFSQVFASV